MAPPQKTSKQIANELARETDSDVIVINAGMERGNETTFIRKCCTSAKRDNAIVLIVTTGGDADVAYRMGRCLQEHYERITALIPGQCKSAGTLLAIGAHELAFSEHGELGPLDVQLRKADDMWAATSGLTVMNAFTALQQKSEEAFADFALRIKVRSAGSVTFKTAADIAQKMTVGLFSHIYQQIEVMHVGEAARAMKIAEEYGQRLDYYSDNLKDGNALSRLIAAYPSHSFVIDQQEAELLFRNVRGLTPRERELCDALGSTALIEDSRLDHIFFLSDAPITQAAANEPQQADHGASAKQEPGAAGASGTSAPVSPAAGAEPGQIVEQPTGTGGA